MSNYETEWKRALETLRKILYDVPDVADEDIITTRHIRCQISMMHFRILRYQNEDNHAFPLNILPWISKSKTVPLHAMEALGGRAGIAPTHS
jgi:hypothetical protein